MTDNGQTVLVVDDESQFRRSLRSILSNVGWVITEARDGCEAIEEIRARCPDLVLLDLKLPGVDGFKTCRGIRELSNVPIIAISVLTEEQAKVSALDAGADDYIVKPFSFQELLARIRALARRIPDPPKRQSFESPELEIDFQRRRVITHGQRVHLTPTEFELLSYLVANQGRVVSHFVLANLLRTPSNRLEPLRVFINHLRNKIEQDPEHPRYIHTEAHIGYRFDHPETRTPTQDLPSR